MTQCLWPVNHCPSIIARNWVQLEPFKCCHKWARRLVKHVMCLPVRYRWLKKLHTKPLDLNNAEKEKYYLPKLGNGDYCWQNIFSTDFTFINCFKEEKPTELKQSSAWERQKCFVMTKMLTADRIEQRQWSGAASEILTRATSDQSWTISPLSLFILFLNLILSCSLEDQTMRFKFRMVVSEVY